MAIFVRRRDEVPVYDEVFARFWQHYELNIEPLELDIEIEAGTGEHEQVGEVRAGDAEQADVAAGAVTDDDATEGDGSSDDEAAGRLSWSERERLLPSPSTV